MGGVIIAGTNAGASVEVVRGLHYYLTAYYLAARPIVVIGMIALAAILIYKIFFSK